MRKQVLTRAQFFALCEALRNAQEQVMTCSTLDSVAKVLRDKLDFKFGESPLREAIELTGIKLAEGRRYAKQSSNRNNTRILANALMALYKQLGVEPSEKFSDLVKRCNTGEAPIQEKREEPKASEESKPVTPAIPVSSVPHPSTIKLLPSNGKA